jgi:transposase
VQHGAAYTKYQQKHQKLYGIHYLAMSKFVDSKHAKGEGVTNRNIWNHLRKEHGIIVARTSVGRAFKKLGLTWMKV